MIFLLVSYSSFSHSLLVYVVLLVRCFALKLILYKYTTHDLKEVKTPQPFADSSWRQLHSKLWTWTMLSLNYFLRYTVCRAKKALDIGDDNQATLLQDRVSVSGLRTMLLRSSSLMLLKLMFTCSGNMGNYTDRISLVWLGVSFSEHYNAFYFFNKLIQQHLWTRKKNDAIGKEGRTSFIRATKCTKNQRSLYSFHSP